MKTNLKSLARPLAKIAVILSITLSTSALADCYWIGVDSSDWSDTNNWGSGFPANAGAGNAIINPAANPCVVSTAGNSTDNGIYISINVGMSIVADGQLTTPTTFVTGVWGNSLLVDITGGELNIGGYLNIGAGGYAGSVEISGGTVTAGALSINSAGGASLIIISNGTFVTSISQLGNVNYWVNNNAIWAGGAAGWSINVNTNAIANMVVVTAVYTPPQTGTNYVFDNGGGNNIWTNQANWNPVGKPGLYDTATIDSGMSVILDSGTEGYVDMVTVGSTNGPGTINIDAGCNVSFRDTNISVIVGGTANSGIFPSYYIQNEGSISTLGDLVLGGNGGWVDARQSAGNCTVGGTLRLGSYMYSADASFTNASLRLIGNRGAFPAIGAIEIGNAGTLSYEFNGGSSVTSLKAARTVNILPGAALVVDGTGFSGNSGNLMLLGGASVTGTFSTVNLTNFPSGVVPSVAYMPGWPNTPTMVVLSVSVAQPNFHLTMQGLGDGQNRILWNFGDLESATNIHGPWTPLCAVSPWVEAASGPQKFYRATLPGTVYEYDDWSGDNLWTTTANWSPAGTPGASDDTVVENGMSIYVTGPAGNVRSVIVGKTTGNGALNINAGGSIVFEDPCKSVIIGGASGKPVNYYRQGSGNSNMADADLSTVGDFVFGFSGGGANAQFAGPGTLSIGGTLQVGSYMSPAYSFFQLLGALGTVTAGGLEVGSVGELMYSFNGDSNLNTLVVSGNVNLQSGSTLTIDGSNFVGGTGTYNYTLIQGGSLTGTFTTNNVSGFPAAGTTAVVSYSGGNVKLTVTVP